MISVYQIKPAFQRSLQPVLKFLYRIGFTANQLTLLALAFSIFLGSMLFFYKTAPLVFLLLPIGLLLRMALNALDGMMARQFDMQSRLGEILNELGDVLSDLAIILPLAILPAVNPWIVVAFGFMAVINEFAGLLGKAMGGERRYEGPMGKSDRALLLGLFCLALYFWPETELLASWIFGGGIILMLISTLVRLKKSIV